MPIVRPTLSIADNGDDTGGVATIAGATSGTVNELFYQAVDGELGTSIWTSLGERVDDGTISFSLAAGYYWFHVVSLQETDSGGSDDNEACSNLVYQNITTGSDAIWEKCLTGVQARIQTLSMSGIITGNVVIHKMPEERKVVKPCVIVAPAGAETARNTDGTNVRDDYGYPVFVGLVATDNQDQTANRERNLKWREQIVRAFQNQRVPGVDESTQCIVETRDVIAPSWFENNLFVSTLVVRCFCRITRGLT